MLFTEVHEVLMPVCPECSQFHMPDEVHGKNTVDGLAHTLRGVRKAVGGDPGKFDRRAWMRAYMRKWRARRKGE